MIGPLRSPGRPRRPRRKAAAGLLGGLFALGLLPGAALSQPPQRQADPPAADDSFFSSVDVNVVNVEVFVTDEEGRFVPGLTRDDFEVYEDGKRVEVTNFYVADAGSGAPEIETEPSPVPEEQRLYLTIFLDNRTLTPAARNVALQNLKDFVRTELRPEDWVQVVSYEGPEKVFVRQGLTRDPEKVSSTLEQARRVTGGGFSHEMEVRQILQEMDDYEEGENGDKEIVARMTRDLILGYAQRRQQEAISSLATLNQFLDALAGLPGRKALLYVSGGFPLRPAEGLFNAWRTEFGGLPDDDLRTELQSLDNDVTLLFDKVGERANSNRVTFYTLGLPGNIAGVAAQQGRNVWGPQSDGLERNSSLQSLQMVTAPTGGRTLFDAGNPKALLAQMRDDFDHYYSLGYSPPARGRSGRHKLEVRVKQPGLKVRHRGSFTDRTSEERLSHDAMAALMLGHGSRNPLDMRVRFEKEEVKKNGEREVTLSVMVPFSKVTLLPQESVHQGKLTLLVGARDAEGRNSPFTKVGLPLRIAESNLPATLKSIAAYRVKVALRPGAHRVAIAMRDEYGNVSSVITAPYPGPAPAAQPAKSGR